MTTKMAKLLAKQRDFSLPNVQMQVLELLLLDAIDNCCLYFAIKHVIRAIVLYKK